MTRKAFVYGTLQEGRGNNWLLSGCDKLDYATIEDYMLYNSGFPVAMPNEGTSIFGEVWEIPDGIHGDRVMEGLDSLESEGYMYNRTKAIAIGKDKTPHEVEFYVGHPDFWSRRSLTECPNTDGLYVWKKEIY